MHISITGGSGYLAGRISEYFSKIESNKISLISRSPKNIELSDNVFAVNLNDRTALESCIYGSDIIIHTAGYNSHSAARQSKDALEFAKTSIENITSLLNPNESPKVIYLSTAHVYRNPLGGEIDELTKLENLHPYALANLEGEKTLLHKAKKIDCHARVLRISNCFGLPANQSQECWNLVLNEMCLSAINKKLININGPENAVRNFLPMRTFLAQLDLLMNSKKEEYPNIINLAHSRSYTMKEVATIIKNRCMSLLDFEPLIIFHDESKDTFKLNYKSKFLKLPFDVEMNFYLELDEMLSTIYQKLSI